jgi:hypothetical protein
MNPTSFLIFKTKNHLRFWFHHVQLLDREIADTQSINYRFCHLQIISRICINMVVKINIFSQQN